MRLRARWPAPLAGAERRPVETMGCAQSRRGISASMIETSAAVIESEAKKDESGRRRDRRRSQRIAWWLLKAVRLSWTFRECERCGGQWARHMRPTLAPRADLSSGHDARPADGACYSSASHTASAFHSYRRCRGK